MKSATLLTLSLVAAPPVLARCGADNCARAVSQKLRTSTQPGYMDCLSFQACYVSPTPATSTTTITVAASDGTRPVPTRSVETAITSCQTRVPTYASPCSGTVRYASACSCAGVTKYTSTYFQRTVVETATVIQSGSGPAPTNPAVGQLSDPFYVQILKDGSFTGQYLKYDASGLLVLVTARSNDAIFYISEYNYLVPNADQEKVARYDTQAPDGESLVDVNPAAGYNGLIECSLSMGGVFSCPNSDGLDNFRICNGHLGLTRSTGDLSNESTGVCAGSDGVITLKAVPT